MQDFYNPMGAMQQPFGAVAPQQSVASDPKSFCQTLTVEQANMLKKQVEEFTLAISEKDKYAAICMHREPGTGKSMLVEAGAESDGAVTCLICGKTFHILDKVTEDDVLKAVENLLDVLQTTKTMYLDMPVESAKNFYPILALIEKVPGLYKVASNNLRQHEKAATANFQQSNTNLMGMYNMLNSPWGSPMGGYGYQPQPQMGYGYPQMGYQPQPMMGQPAPGSNPFFTAPPQQQAPMMGYQPQPVAPGYQPQQTAYAYTPNNMTQNATVAQPDPAAAPQVAPAQATTDGTTVNVTQSFQA